MSLNISYSKKKWYLLLRVKTMGDTAFHSL